MGSKPLLLIADEKNKFYEAPGLVACGMSGYAFRKIEPSELIPLPFGSELFVLPQRLAVGKNLHTGKFNILKQNPVKKSRACFPVAAFVSPGYTSTLLPAYVETEESQTLPLFSYSAVAWYNGKIYVAATRVDRERRQDLRLMNFDLMKQNIEKFTKLMPKNRLVRHLKKCALIYCCPAARNFFLQRCECPLPSSTICNSSFNNKRISSINTRWPCCTTIKFCIYFFF